MFLEKVAAEYFLRKQTLFFLAEKTAESGSNGCSREILPIKH